MDSSFQIINGTSLSDLCDFSFGDHLGGMSPNELIGGFMIHANGSATDFLDKCKLFEGRIMTLFIDNIRLYPRTLEVKSQDANWIVHLMSNNDLLGLCASLTNNRFVIFTSHEDTPIDESIVVPNNVLGIHAVNAEYFGGKIYPFPYGLQRKIDRINDVKDNRLEIMKELVERDDVVEPTQLLYINCGIERHENRWPLQEFEGYYWCTCRFDKDSMFFTYDKYRDFLTEIKDHKFMVCPRGNGMDCHRNWESLYLRRVPVMLKSPYFTRLMEGFPVLFVDKWSDITEHLLVESDYLFQEAKQMDLSKLDLNLIFNSIIAKYETM